MTIFAAGGQEMKLVTDKEFIAKKRNENLIIVIKLYVMYLKRKFRTCRIQVQVEKV